jgi:hypothetical protein
MPMNDAEHLAWKSLYLCGLVVVELILSLAPSPLECFCFLLTPLDVLWAGMLFSFVSWVRIRGRKIIMSYSTTLNLNKCESPGYSK